MSMDLVVIFTQKYPILVTTVTNTIPMNLSQEICAALVEAARLMLLRLILLLQLPHARI